jgi:putative oxidoreductase
MSDISFLDVPRERLIFPALDGFYRRLAEPMAWSVFRFAIGAMLVVEGWPKIMAPFAQVGFVESLGFYPGFVWSPLLAILQVVGGALIALGLFTRPAALANGVMLAITLWFHYAHPYGDALLTQAGIDALAAQPDLFTANAASKLADGGAKFLTQVQDKAILASLFWTGGAFLYAAFGGGAYSVDRLLKKQF